MPLSGQKTVTAAGIAEALGLQRVCAPLMVKALTTNPGLTLYIGAQQAIG